MRLNELGIAPTVKAHSIIAVQHDPPQAGGCDGVVHMKVPTSIEWRRSCSCLRATCARTGPR